MSVLGPVRRLRVGAHCIRGRWALLVFVLVLWGGGGAYAQSSDESVSFCQSRERRTATLDTRGLGAVYCTTNPAVARPLQAAHVSARPLFYGIVPLAGGSAALLRDDGNYADVYRLALAQGATYGLVVGIKHAVGRPRPYVRRALTSRSAHHSASQTADTHTSLPSGHAALSAALVTSWALSHPKWYVWGPGGIWAVGVSLSRLRLGVHYPSDVLIGAGIGVGVALLVHQIRGALTPNVNGEGSGGALREMPPVALRFRF